MGHVKLETLSQGRGIHEYDHISYSDPKIIARLLALRSKIDAAYQLKYLWFPRGMRSMGAPKFSENIIDIYIDIDRLIKKAKLSKIQKLCVDRIMDGWIAEDIVEEYHLQRSNVSRALSTACVRIAKANGEMWENWVENNYKNAPFYTLDPKMITKHP